LDFSDFPTIENANASLLSVSVSSGVSLRSSVFILMAFSQLPSSAVLMASSLECDEIEACFLIERFYYTFIAKVKE